MLGTGLAGLRGAWGKRASRREVSSRGVALRRVRLASVGCALGLGLLGGPGVGCASWTGNVRLGGREAGVGGRVSETPAISLPTRSPGSPGGVAFAERTTGLDMPERQAAALAQIRAGNVPGSVRRLVPVTLRAEEPGADGGEGTALEATVWVSPDYLAIGSDADFLRWPVTWPAAQALCRALGVVPATTRIADAVWAQAAVKLEPQPIPPSAAMMSNPCFLEHQRLVEEQRAGIGPERLRGGQLTAGHKKDVVLTGRLHQRPGKVAIYGWHYPDGHPIQPLSTVHIAGYADYSHGLRLVHPVAQVKGGCEPSREVPLLEALGDPALAPLFSDEGVIERAAELLGVAGPE